MKQKIQILSLAIVAIVFSSVGIQAQDASFLKDKYGPNYREIIEKAAGDITFLEKAEKEYAKQRNINFFNQRFNSSKAKAANNYIGGSENEPNNFFNEATNIDNILSMDGLLNNGEYKGRLVSGEFSSDADVDVYEFTVDTTKMYYFGGLHGQTTDGEEMGVHMRLYHESDLDTSYVEGFKGIDGNDQIKGDILGADTDGRGGAGLFRLTGWSSPIDPVSREKLTGKFYLWIFNSDGDQGTYSFTAYQINRTDWVDKAEDNYPYENLLLNAANPVNTLDADAVVRSFMLYAPDTVKYQHPLEKLPTQSNGTYDNLLAQGDEDTDLFFVNYKKDHTLVIETIPYFGYYRESDGSPAAGSSRLSDSRIRVYDGEFTNILFEDDDGAREHMDGPNNIMSRLVMSSDALGEKGITDSGPLVLWMGAWASQTREPGRTVNNSDPGRMMYKLYAYQYSNNPSEVEPNNTVEEATVIAARNDTTVSGNISSGSDKDMYRVFLHEARMYTMFSESELGSNIDVKIYLENASGPDNETQVSNDLVAENSLDVKRNGTDFLLQGFIPEESGAYIVELSSSAIGDYKLGILDKGEVFFGSIAHGDDETIADATVAENLVTGAGAPPINAMIYPANDVDIYQFITGDDVSITIRPTNEDLVNDFTAKLTLFNDAGTEITSTTNGIISYTPSERGTFFVKVEANNSGEVGFYTLSGGEPFEEKEPNDTAENATEIAIGEQYEAELSSSSDVDYFKAYLVEGSLYSFRSVDNETGAPLNVEFMDAEDGEHLLDDSGWADNYDGNFKIANIIPQTSKFYYFKISGNPGTYKLLSRSNSNFGTLKNAHEPDNTIAQANALPAYTADGVDRMYVQFAADSARYFGDLDYFKVELTAGQQLVAETKPVGGNTTASADVNFWNKDNDTKLRLFSADGTEIASDDDGGNEWYSKITHTVATSGTYFVQVANSRGGGSGDDRSMRRGDYILNISAGNEETEPNNTIAEAANNPLFDNGNVSAVFSDASDVDYFKLSLKAGRIYHVRTDKENEGVIGAELFKDGSSTNQLNDSGFNTRYSGDNIKINFIPDSDADYYLKLTAPDGADAFEYKLYMKSNNINALIDIYEPNNSIEDASALGYYETDGIFRDQMLYDANVEGFHDDLDYYKVKAAAGDTITAETAPFNGEFWSRDFDAYMYLYDAEGNELETNDDGGFDWHSKISYIVPEGEGGDYYFLVVGQDAHVSPRDDDSDRIVDPARGEYKFAITTTGEVITSNEDETLAEVNEFKLEQNYPNPFNPSTNIRYALDVSGDVRLDVFNLLGQKVSTLVNTRQRAGSYSVTFDASNLASGVYIYRLQAGSKVQINKMMLIK